MAIDYATAGRIAKVITDLQSLRQTVTPDKWAEVTVRLVQEYKFSVDGQTLIGLIDTLLVSLEAEFAAISKGEVT